MTQGATPTLKVSVNNGKACQKILKIEVEQDVIQKEYELFYKSVAAKAKIPGFRPGKAPKHVLEMHFGNEAKQSVLKNLISDSYSQALRENSIEPIGYPSIKDVDFRDDKLSYSAHVEIRPKMKLSKVSGLSAKRGKAELGADEVDQSLKRIQESLAQYKVVEDRPAQMGDFVIAEHVCFVDGKEVDKRADDWFELKDEKDEFLKGFSTQLTGVKAGDEKEVTIQFPENFSREAMAGKTGVFKVKVKEIKIKSLPEINDDLAKDAGEFETLADLKQKIEKDILTHKERDVEVNYENALLDELVKQNKIDLPEGLVQRRIEHLIEQAKHEWTGKGLPEADFEKQLGEMKPEIEKDARKQVHLAFLMDEIAQQQNIQATDDDLNLKFQELSLRFRQEPDKIAAYYKEHEDALDSLRDQIRSEKVVAWLKQNAKQK